MACQIISCVSCVCPEPRPLSWVPTPARPHGRKGCNVILYRKRLSRQRFGRRFATAAASASPCTSACFRSVSSTDGPRSRPSFTFAAGELRATGSSGAWRQLRAQLRHAISTTPLPGLRPAASARFAPLCSLHCSLARFRLLSVLVCFSREVDTHTHTALYILSTISCCCC